MLNELIAWLPWIIGAVFWVAGYAVVETYILPKFPKLLKFLDKLAGIE